jgi:hypothetical protein
MNWYFYWYYTIYNIYKRYSWDNHFDIFATSLFSFFVMCFIIGLSSYISLLFNFKNIIFLNIQTMTMFVILTFSINYILFLPHKRQTRMYEVFLENYSQTQNIFFILLSLLSVIICFSVLFLGKNYFN